jgi:hypothetical protein
MLPNAFAGEWSCLHAKCSLPLALPLGRCMGAKPAAEFASYAAPIAALTLGSTFSAIRIIERLASAGSRQSLPA